MKDYNDDGLSNDVLKKCSQGRQRLCHFSLKLVFAFEFRAIFLLNFEPEISICVMLIEARSLAKVYNK